MAQSKRTHRIQTPLTHLQSPHNHPTSVAAQPHLCSTSSQHSFFISRHFCSAINIILVTYNWSFLSICLTLSLESTSQISPSTSSLCLWLTCYAPTTSSHSANSLLSPFITPSLSLPPQDLPLSQNPSHYIDSRPASGLILQTFWLDRFFWTSRFFVFNFLHYYFFGSVQQTKLAIRQLLGARKYSVS